MEEFENNVDSNVLMFIYIDCQMIYMYMYYFVVETDIAKLLEHPYNKYLWDNSPRPSEIIFPKRVHKKADQIGISTREKHISHHVSMLKY